MKIVYIKKIYILYPRALTGGTLKFIFNEFKVENYKSRFNLVVKNLGCHLNHLLYIFFIFTISFLSYGTVIYLVCLLMLALSDKDSLL